jgi:dihydropyrimidinase
MLRHDAQLVSGTADLIVRNGIVVSASAAVRADAVVADGRVRALTEPGTPVPGRPAEIDATDRLVLPGGVDPHCHVGFTSGSLTTLDDYRQATTAAIFAGTTTIVDFAIPRSGEMPIDVARIQQAKATQGGCDSALHACIVEWDDSVPGQLRDLAQMGIATVKMFTTYRGETMASDEAIFKVMKELHQLGGIVFVHCEANHIIEDQQERSAANGRISARYHRETRPAIAETASVSAVISMAETLGAPVYLVHQSSPESLELAAAARLRGTRVISEAVTHHLVLDDTRYDHARPERYVCCQPLRPRTMVDAMTAGLWNGSITAIGSDHCCYDEPEDQREPRRAHHAERAAGCGASHACCLQRVRAQSRPACRPVRRTLLHSTRTSERDLAPQGRAAAGLRCRRSDLGPDAYPAGTRRGHTHGERLQPV